jgi:hypothetical protein
LKTKNILEIQAAMKEDNEYFEALKPYYSDRELFEIKNFKYVSVKEKIKRFFDKATSFRHNDLMVNLAIISSGLLIAGIIFAIANKAFYFQQESKETKTLIQRYEQRMEK